MSAFEIPQGEYGVGELHLSDCPDNPMLLLKKWLKEAREKGIKDYNGMVLSTCLRDRPNSRVVLYKKIESDSLIFFSHYNSVKAMEIEANPRVHLLFFWTELERQVRMEGICNKIEAGLSDAYFSQRDKNSQIASIISRQSLTLPSRNHLDKLVEKKSEELERLKVKRPDYWGGYRVKLNAFEFWQGRKSRLNDRVRYDQMAEEVSMDEGDGNQWQKRLLYP